MNNNAKDTVYVDVEDEITAIIDKVIGSKQKIVAVVLPKRAAVLHSIVNMRLLKRSAENANKSLVLITSEHNLMPLAGAAGLYVAKNLQTKPHIPAPPSGAADNVSSISDGDPNIDEMPLNPETPVGELATDEDETIDFDNDEAPAAAGAVAAKKASKPKKDSKLKVPNFDKFRLFLFAGIAALILLIVFGLMATFVLPKATVSIKTDTIPVEASVQATISTSAGALDVAKKIVPSSTKTYKQVDTEKAPATGQKDLGEKASGTLTLSVTDCSSVEVTVPAGTLVTSNGLSYITQADVTMNSVTKKGQCVNSQYPDLTTSTVNIIAQAPGANYNTGQATFTVRNFGNVSGSSSGVSGGTTNVVKVITQGDVDGAVQKINSKNTNTADNFYKQLEDSGLFVLRETGTATEPKITTTPNVGDQADAVNVTQEVTYSVQTVQRTDLAKLLTAAFNAKIDTNKQQLSPGNLLTGASIRVGEKQSKTDASLTIQKSTTAMPIINNDEMKKLAAGKKSGELQNLLASRPGIKQVDVKFSPFWVSSVPKNVNKITVVVNKTGS